MNNILWQELLSFEVILQTNKTLENKREMPKSLRVSF